MPAQLDPQDLIAELDAVHAAGNPDYAADTDIRDATKASMWTTVATAVHRWLVGGAGASGALPGANVAFAAGTITGLDAPSGDSHNALSATGGAIE